MIRLTLIPMIVAVMTGPLPAEAQDRVSPSEPHGIVTTDASMPASDLYEIRIRAINGREVPDGQDRSVWLRPGTHQIKVVQPTVDLSATARIGRSHLTAAQARKTNSIELEVEEGATYYLAMDTQSARASDWKVVVTRTEFSSD